MRRQPRFLLLVLCLVVLCEAVGSQQQSPTVNLRPGGASSPPGIPQVRVTVDRRRVPLGTSVTFSLWPASVVNDYVVTLYFGDGHKQEMTAPQAFHEYEKVGTYTYAVDVKPRQKARQRCDARVTLSASPISVLETQPVKFSAELLGNCPNIQYRFVYGDGSSSNLQSSPNAQHSYATAGQYLAYVDISDNNGHIGGSLRKRIEVTQRGSNVDPRNNVSVSLTAEPLPAQSGKPVTFIATASPARPGARYQFSFGDGKRTSWQTDPQAQHTYKTQGVYRALVAVSQFVNNQNLSATSTPALLRVGSAVGPTPGPSPRPSPTPRTGPSPAPTADTSPTPSNSPTPSPGNGSPSPGSGSPSPGSGSSSPGSSPSGSNGTTVTGSETPSPAASNSPGLLGDTSPGRTWLYLLIAAVILFLIYQASGFLFAAQPTFSPFADHGVAAVAHEKGALPIDFQLVLDPNVSGGDYSVTTDQPRLVTNAPETEERQIIEI